MHVHNLMVAIAIPVNKISNLLYSVRIDYQTLVGLQYIKYLTILTSVTHIHCYGYTQQHY